MDVKRTEITFTSYISNRARRVKVVASRPDAAVVWFFWAGPIVNLEAGHRPLEGGSSLGKAFSEGVEQTRSPQP